MTTHYELLQDLVKANKPSEVDAILMSIGDRSDLGEGERFGEANYIWSFYGGTDSNLSTIHLGSKPGRSLTERITNAIDAVLEEKMAAGGTTPASPMEAAKQWFGRPPTTSDNGLFTWDNYGIQDIDRLVQLVMTSGDDKSEPTIDVLDAGIGIPPNKFGDTIVSIKRGNKAKKAYVVGAFGQGGSATIRYSKYTLIVSRHIAAPSTVGFTLVRLMRLPDPYKVNAYVYLTVMGEDGTLTVPSCRVDEKLDYYPTIPFNSVRQWDKGTLVRHFGYQLRDLANPLQATPGNLYHLLQGMMFDPLIPFRLIDLRIPKPSGKFKNEVIRGSRNRLMAHVLKATKGAQVQEEVSEPGDTEEAPAPKGILRHHAPRQMVSLRSDANPNVGIEYWVVLSEKKSGDKVTLRPSSELFVDRGHPILGTLHGQNQGERTDLILKELDLPTLAKHIVVHIDASNADRDTRLGLFVSTREGFAEGNEYKELMRLLKEILRDDEELIAIENELVAKVIERETAGINSEVKKELSDLLRDAGLEVTQPGDSIVPGDGQDTMAPTGKGKKPRIPEPPLDTLPYPEVTRFEIVYPEDLFAIPMNERHVVKLETNADFRFDRENRIALRAEPKKLEVASKNDLRSGRMKWRLRPSEDAKPGDTGEIIATITRLDGSQIESRIRYEVRPSREVRAKRAKGLVPDFDIRPFDPYIDDDVRNQLWPNASDDDIPTLAYKAEKFGTKIIIYYSTAFTPFKAQFEKLKNQVGQAQLFQQYYQIWIGYHAILQYTFRKTLDLDPEPDAEATPVVELYSPQIQSQLQERERALVAEMQVKQALKSAELKAKLMKESIA